MKLTVKSGKNVYVYNGVQNYTGKTGHMLIMMFDGEPDLYDWDGTEEGVAELKRYYRNQHGVNLNPLRYNEVI